MQSRAKVYTVSKATYQTPHQLLNTDDSIKDYRELLQDINVRILPMLIKEGIKRGDLIKIEDDNERRRRRNPYCPDYPIFHNPSYIFTGTQIDLTDALDTLAEVDEFPLAYWSDYFDNVYGWFDPWLYSDQILKNLTLDKSRNGVDLFKSQFTHKSGEVYTVWLYEDLHPSNKKEFLLRNGRLPDPKRTHLVLADAVHSRTLSLTNPDIDHTCIIYC